VGPDTDIVQLLRYHDYTYPRRDALLAAPQQDPEQVADAFEHGKIRGQSVRVTPTGAPQRSRPMKVDHSSLE